ncbi:MAG: hypothetical protein ABSD31_07280 [Candidatus Binataceae bacterium]
MLIPSAAYACPLCFGSSPPRVLHAYYLSAVILVGLAWTLIAGICLYAFRMYGRDTESSDETTIQSEVRSQKVLLFSPHRQDDSQ